MPTEAELLAARQAGYLTPSGQNLMRDGDDAISNNAVTAHQAAAAAHQAAAAARYDRGAFPLGGDMATLPPGSYDVRTYTVAQSAQPALPTEALAGGSLVISPGTTYKSVEFVPVGLSERPLPVWRNEFNVNQDPQWQGWHRVDARAHQHPVGDVTGLEAALNSKVGTTDARLSDARTPTAHTHDDRYQLVLPITLGSTEDLDAITIPRRYRCISGSIASNTALHYPPGAVHGFLDVIEMGTGYRWQLWNDTWNHWQAARRLFAGAWTPWTRLAKGDADAAVAPVAARVKTLEEAVVTQPQVAVQPGSAVVYGPDRPDAWAHPGSTVYWHHPAGTTIIPSDYRGDGYVGKLAAATGYSQMLITKAEASGTVDVSCINPTTGRHVTYRLQGAWDGAAGGMDAFQRIEETWVGAVTAGKPSPDTLVLPRSNIEWAFQIDVAGSNQFVPHHGTVTAVDAGRPRGLFRMDGTAIDLSAVTVGGTITGLNGIKHRQSVYARHPDSGTTDWVRIDQITTISPDGMLQSESTWTALRDVVVGSNYGPMTPIQTGAVDQMHVLGGASYPIDTVPPATTRYDTVNEGKAMTSALFTGTGTAFVATAFLDPAETLLRDHPLSETQSPVRIENRSGGGLVKLYPSGFDTAVTVPAGTVWRMGAQWRYGEAPADAITNALTE